MVGVIIVSPQLTSGISTETAASRSNISRAGKLFITTGFEPWGSSQSSNLVDADDPVSQATPKRP